MNSTPYGTRLLLASMSLTLLSGPLVGLNALPKILGKISWMNFLFFSKRDAYFWKDKWLGMDPFAFCFHIYICCPFWEIIRWLWFCLLPNFFWSLPCVFVFCWLIGEHRMFWPLLALLGDFHFRPLRGDVCFWSPCPSKGLSCRYFFRYLVSSSQGSDSISSVWKVKIPKKVGWVICCILSWRVGEILDHLLLSCEFAGAVWSCFFEIFSFGFVSSQGCREAIEGLLFHSPFFEKWRFLW